jgi:diadenosine tetraphosphatase ApaH/serine/threonine PP2A family protein phosphatase
MIAFLSDIHSNTEALTAALAEVERQRADRLLCLGDIIGYGPEPRETLRTIMARCEFSLRGNHEEGALGYASDFNPRARVAIDWTKKQLTPPECPRAESYQFWNYLDKLQKTHREGDVLMVHASPKDPIREYVVPKDAQDKAKMDEWFRCMDGARICFVGHSHVPGVYLESGRYLSPTDVSGTYRLGKERVIVNIGSIGQPRDGDVRASFVLFDGEVVRFVRVPYAFEKTMAKIRATTELDKYLAERLALGR